MAQFYMQPRSPARWSSWVSTASLPTSVLRVPLFDGAFEMNAVLKPQATAPHIVADLALAAWGRKEI
ncbi:MAG: hypothetical protein ABI520_12545, partial [Caldimonas sp.]